MITVVGMGRYKGDLTLSAQKIINSAKAVAVRTLKTEPSKILADKNPYSMDKFFDSAENFNELNNLIVTEILALEKKYGSIVYCVDGDGCSDSSVIELKSKADINIIAGVSSFAEREPSLAFAVFSANEYVRLEPSLDTNIGLSVFEIDNKLIAGEVKLLLLEYYNPQTELKFSAGKTAKIILLEDLDRQPKYDYSSGIFIEAQTDIKNKRYCYADLINIIKRLTGPDGCEWDKVQTHNSIEINMIEEAYEAVDAIKSGDTDAIIEETGDIMLQTVLHADIGKRGGEYNINDVIDSLCNKLVSRHTHIFGENKAENSEEALNFWEKAKQKEKKQKSLSDSIDSIPDNFPVSLRIEKIINKSQKAGITYDLQELNSRLKSELDGGGVINVLLLSYILAALKSKHPETEIIAKCEKLAEVIKKSAKGQIISMEEILK